MLFLTKIGSMYERYEDDQLVHQARFPFGRARLVDCVPCPVIDREAAREARSKRFSEVESCRMQTYLKSRRGL